MKNTCRCHKHVTFYWECCIIKSTLSLYQGGNYYKVPSHVNRTVDTDLIMQISKYCYLLSVLQGQNYYITTVILTLEALFSLYGHSTMERVIVVYDLESHQLQKWFIPPPQIHLLNYSISSKI